MFGIPIAILTGYILALMSLIIIYWLYFIKRSEVIPDLRGKDKTWQIIELASIIWLIIMPMMVVADLLGVHATSQVWASMDAIYFISVGGKLGFKHLENKKELENTKEEKNKEIKKDEQVDP